MLSCLLYHQCSQRAAGRRLLQADVTNLKARLYEADEDDKKNQYFSYHGIRTLICKT